MFKVKIKDFYGKDYDVELSGNENIFQMKKLKLHPLTNCPAEWCRLKFGDFELDNNRRINYYQGIKEGSTLTMIKR
jgi:hypothetical protein